jgi:hypothetical protein
METTLDGYLTAIKSNNFQEFPQGIWSGMTMLEHFINFKEAELDLKIHIKTVVLNRNFSWLDGH